MSSSSMSTQPTSWAHSAGELQTSPVLGPTGASSAEKRIPSGSGFSGPAECEEQVVAVERGFHGSLPVAIRAPPYARPHRFEELLRGPRICHDT